MDYVTKQEFDKAMTRIDKRFDTVEENIQEEIQGSRRHDHERIRRSRQPR